MPDRINALLAFLRELKRRRVVHAVVVYAGAAFLILEGVSNLADALSLSEALQRIVAIVVILGFPVTVVAAWIYERTPEGLKRAPVSAPSAAGRRATVWGLGLMLAAATVAAGVVATRWYSAPGELAVAMETAERPTVLAVMPFDHPEDGAAAQGLAMALEAQVEAALHESPAFSIRWRSALRPLLAEGVPLDSIARLLGIDFFVNAVVNELDGAPSLMVQLVDARTMEVIRSATVRESAAGTIGLLESMSRRIEDILRPALGRQVQLRRWRAGTRDSMAFHFRWLAEQRRESGLDLPGVSTSAILRELTAADSLLRLAIERDPEWREPRLARAENSGTLAMALLPTRDTAATVAAFDQGILCADEVLARHDDDPDALALRGHLLWRKANFFLDGEGRGVAVDRAEADLRLAFELDPEHPLAAAALSELLWVERGAYEEARYYGEAAYRLDSYREDATIIVDRIAMSAFETGDDEAAVYWCREGLRRHPDHPIHHACMLNVLALGDAPPDPAAARAHFEAVKREAAGPSAEAHTLFLLAAVLGRAGQEDSAQNALQEARRVADRTLGPGSLLWVEAGVRFRLGDQALGQRLVDELWERDPDVAAYHASRRILRDYVAPPPSLPG